MNTLIKRIIIFLLPTKYYLWCRRFLAKRNDPIHFKALQDLRQSESKDKYSLKVFDQTQSIFVHIPKCAGISVCDSLYDSYAGGHYHLDSYVDAFEPIKILKYYKFTFVRNPWDRVVSAYHFLSHGGLNQSDAEFYESELKEFKDFDDFVKRWLNADNIQKRVHFHPQTDFILERHGKINLDFIGYFENLDEDFQLIAKKIGCTKNLAVRNRSQHQAYTDYYSESTRALVADVYRKDIEFLGYDFYNENLESVLSRRNIS